MIEVCELSYTRLTFEATGVKDLHTYIPSSLRRGVKVIFCPVYSHHFIVYSSICDVSQIVPLGCEWAADSYYGTPAVKLGLQYLEYKINVSESSLSRDYGAEDVVLTNPQRVQQEKGWFFSKEIYLERQNVTLDLNRVREVLIGTKEKLGQWPAYAKRMEKMSKLKRCQKRLRKGGSSDGIEVDSI